MHQAARVNDAHTCPKFLAIVPHVGGVITGPGASTVNIGSQPAALEGDECACLEPDNKIEKGSSTVNIENKPAARMGDMTAHGGTITGGEPTVNIGG